MMKLQINEYEQFGNVISKLDVQQKLCLQSDLIQDFFSALSFNDVRAIYLQNAGRFKPLFIVKFYLCVDNTFDILLLLHS